MKITLQTIAFLFTAAVILLGPGCGSLDPAGPYRGDRFLFKADETIATAYDLLDGFVTWEYQNRAALAGVPEIRKAADHIRGNARNWIDTATRLRDAYAATPSPDNKDALKAALAVIRQALTETASYLAKYDAP